MLTVHDWRRATPEARALLARAFGQRIHREDYAPLYETTCVNHRLAHPRTPTHRGAPA